MLFLPAPSGSSSISSVIAFCIVLPRRPYASRLTFESLDDNWPNIAMMHSVLELVRAAHVSSRWMPPRQAVLLEYGFLAFLPSHSQRCQNEAEYVTSLLPPACCVLAGGQAFHLAPLSFAAF